MRVSDWSSDVCSSDLALATAAGAGQVVDRLVASVIGADAWIRDQLVVLGCGLDHRCHAQRAGGQFEQVAAQDERCLRHLRLGFGPYGGVERAERSEEHTSELQSLMRISYAVFCLKKKKK